MVLSVYLFILTFSPSRALFAPQSITNHQSGHESYGQFKLKPFPAGKHVYTIVPQVNLSTVLRPLNVGCYKDLKIYYLANINNSITPIFAGDVNAMIDKGVRAFRSPINESFELTYTSDESMDCEDEFIFGRHVPENFTCPRSFYKATKRSRLLPQIGRFDQLYRRWSRPIDVCVFQFNSSSMVEIRMFLDPKNNETAIFVYETNNYAAGLQKEINRVEILSDKKRVFTSSTNSVTVVMYRVKTYALSFRQTERECKCNPDKVKLDASPYYEISTGYPDDYCLYLQCNTTFTAASQVAENLRTAIVFKLNDFDLPNLDWIGYWPGGFKVKMNDFRNLKLNSIVVFNETAHLRPCSWGHQPRRGYNMTVEAVAVHKDCTCPELDGNRLYFEIKPWCEYVDCLWDFGHGNDSNLRMDRRLKIFDNSVIHHETEFLGLVRHPWLPVSEITIPTLGHHRLAYIKGERYSNVLWFHRQKNSDGMNGHSLVDIAVEIKADCGCPERKLKASLEWATFNLPGSPDSYCRDVTCWSNITSPEGTVIEVRLELPPPPYLAKFYVYDEPVHFHKKKGRTMISLWRHNITISQNVSSSNIIGVGFNGLDFEYAEPFYLRYRYVRKGSPTLLSILMCLLIGLLAVTAAFMWKRGR
ncbi:unnamed protein product [Bursaphelenchus xylophilus]|uniref:(pine wood nematode) hypothetical protein n=1 Tax=Bursaphelenchus xylophilus TaxID=6326 RepID=A0A1I7RKD6_BURXY|nr:unnamed protein product [Bursaphelenchus xylophilus]CAG9131371.1 unnamed protein product [Bursaphelenchus xylophilus]